MSRHDGDEGRWIEVADRVFARRYIELNLTVGLVIGDGGCLVVDTRGDAEQGAELATAVREVTAEPWTLVITHAHFDHSFGTVAFLPCAVWAHRGCLAELAERPEEYRSGGLLHYREQGRHDHASALTSTDVIVPNHPVDKLAELSIGDRRVVLAHFGPGHTHNDLVVHVPDADVAFAGDLVEQSDTGTLSADSFGQETDLAGWSTALAGLLELRPTTVVPGHGGPVNTEFVTNQQRQLRVLAEVALAWQEGSISTAEATSCSTLPATVTTAALEQLTGNRTEAF